MERVVNLLIFDTMNWIILLIFETLGRGQQIKLILGGDSTNLFPKFHIFLQFLIIQEVKF